MFHPVGGLSASMMEPGGVTGATRDLVEILVDPVLLEAEVLLSHMRGGNKCPVVCYSVLLVFVQEKTSSFTL